METIALNTIEEGESGVIAELQFPEDQKLRFIELGFLPGEHIRLIRYSPWRDPIEVEVMGIRHGIRSSAAALIQITKLGSLS